MKARVKPGPRPGWGRVDIDNFDGEYVIKGLGTFRPSKIGRFQIPCLIFPLSPHLRVGDEVEVEPVLRCRLCGTIRAALINDLCDNCYEFSVVGDTVNPPLAAALTGGRGR